MSTILRWICRAGTALGGAAILWTVVEIVTVDNRWAVLYVLAYLFLILLNLAPTSGFLVARALPPLSPSRRIAFFLSWALPSIAVLLIDAFVMMIAMSGAR